MGRKVLLGWWVAVSVVVAGGCFHDRGMLAADPDLLAAVARSGSVGGPDEQVARAQKPEATTVSRSTLLDLPPDRTTEVASVPAAARIRVTVNGEAILDEEIRAACYQALVLTRSLPEPERSKKQAEIWFAARDQLVDREVVLQDAFARLSGNKNMTKFLDKLKEAAAKEFEHSVLRAVRESSHKKTDEELKEWVQQNFGISLPMVKRQWERQFMATEYLKSLIYNQLDKIGHAQILEYYDTHPEEFQTPDLVQWQDIFIDASRHPARDAAKRFAEVLVARARAGQDFTKLAEQFDNGESSRRENAAGEGQKHGEIRPAEVEPVVFKLKEGEVGLVEMPNGFHIVRVAKRTYAGMLAFDEKVQKAIKEKLRNDLGQREMKRRVMEMKRKAIIEYSAGTD
jgi:parvulin-like peptidyl-prolyl isomerase